MLNKELNQINFTLIINTLQVQKLKDFLDEYQGDFVFCYFDKESCVIEKC